MKLRPNRNPNPESFHQVEIRIIPLEDFVASFHGTKHAQNLFAEKR